MTRSSVDPTELVARGYQDEMFERSMRGNVIVVLETGSGKTLIAALRIKAELERCGPDRMVWFLSPGVELCRQQHNFLASYLPAVRTRLLVGSDNMDRWLEQRVWDAALDKVRLVVSTHAVLLQALEHAFVRISRLALLVFDEAHHCIKKHAANRIMQEFYHPAKSVDASSVPHILGLSASLVMRSNLRAIQSIESNLDSVGATPRSYRQELSEHVNRPECLIISYSADRGNQALRGTALSALTRLTGADIVFSPDVERFQQRAEYIRDTLGVWVADYFVVRAIEAVSATSEPLGSVISESRTMDDATAVVKLSQQATFKQTIESGISEGSFGLSGKVQRLLEFLAEQPVASTKCLIFAERRDVAHLLPCILTHHPATAGRFKSASFVGGSRHMARRLGLGDLVDMKAQNDVLERFRADEIDVLVATNALEEGIDVQSCNLVICFDPPTNLKSFIQRRGRARQKRSTLALLAAAHEDETTVQKWQALEAELLLLCQQDRELSRDIDSDEDDEEVELSLSHPTTGALINADNALAHLQHFYSSLTFQPHAEPQPIFTYDRGLADDGISAWVSLPDCIPLSPRKIHSQQAWASEKAARKDAAFHAYKALFEAGLLNDHLLPLTHDWTPSADFDTLPQGQFQGRPQLNIWQDPFLSTAPPDWYRTSIAIYAEQSRTVLASLALITQCKIPRPASIVLRRFTFEACEVTFAEPVRLEGVTPEDIYIFQRCTAVIFRSTRSSRLSLDLARLSAMLVPDNVDDLSNWLEALDSDRTAEDAYAEALALPFLVRVPLPNQPVFVARAWDQAPDQPLSVSCSRMTRSRYAFDPDEPVGSQESSIKDQRSFLARDCLVEGVHHSMVLASLLLPPIFYHISDHGTAWRLRQEILPSVAWNDLKHTVEAIRAPAANRETNYQRLEFLGDCVLKFVASQYLFCAHPAWPEGYLTKRRGHLICNERLAAEATERGLDRYIITDQSYYRDWTLPTISEQPSASRSLSVKLLADVLEALIGATVVDTEMDMATARMCISNLIPDIPPVDPPFPARLSVPSEHTVFLHEAEALIGYTFKDRTLLLEALTLSAIPSMVSKQSYQRLEFLGDAVLDLLVMMLMWDFQDPDQPLSQGQMTRTRAAVVNSHLLGFLCLRHRRDQEAQTVLTDENGHFRIATNSHAWSIWAFLRHASRDVTDIQARCQRRYEQHGPNIDTALFKGSYPWVELATLRPAKVFSDLIESVIGAIFVDSGGSIQPCKDFVALIGLTDCVKHMVRDSVDLAHPRDQMQRLAGADTIAFNVDTQTDGLYSGTLTVGDAQIAQAADCPTNELAILNLSLDGSRVLRQKRTSTSGD